MMHTEENDMNNVFFAMKRKNRKITVLSLPEYQIQMGRRYQYDVMDDGEKKIMEVGSITALEIEKAGIKVGETIEIITNDSPPNPPIIRRVNESQPILQT